jgi:hypothetical protein
VVSSKPAPRSNSYQLVGTATSVAPRKTPSNSVSPRNSWLFAGSNRIFPAPVTCIIYVTVAFAAVPVAELVSGTMRIPLQLIWLFAVAYRCLKGSTHVAWKRIPRGRKL